MTQPEEYSFRRKRLMRLVGSGLIILPPNPKSVYSHDKHYKYRYNSNIYYYSGIVQEDTVILLDVPENKSYLFILDNDPETEKWDGKRISRELASDTSGFMMVYPLSELVTKLKDLIQNASIVHYQIGINHFMDNIVEEIVNEFNKDIEDPTPRLDTIRLIKDEEEIDLIEKSVSITVNAHLEAIQHSEPGMTEYELEALYDYHFRINGARMPMHQATIATGINAIFLHHRASDREIQEGDLILVDTGCEYQGYTADVARTWPSAGKFTESQKQLYQIVIDAHKACLSMVKPGVKYWDIHETAVEILVDGLMKVGLLKGSKENIIQNNLYMRYFMHGIGHFIGLDGHDCSTVDRKEVILQPGMVLTIEPGLYIPTDEDIEKKFRGIGIRVEDNLVITSEGAINLSEKLPLEIEDIEELIGSMIE